MEDEKCNYKISEIILSLAYALVKIKFRIKSFFKRNLKKIAVILAFCAVSFMVYFYFIDFNIRLLGRLPINHDIISPVDEYGNINEDYPWEFKYVMQSADSYWSSKKINIEKDVFSLIDDGAKENGVFLYLKTDEDTIGEFTLALIKSKEGFTNNDVYEGLLPQEVRNIEEVKLHIYNSYNYKIVYVLDHKFDCWIPCFVTIYSPNQTLVNVWSPFNALGNIDYSLFKGNNTVSETMTSLHYSDSDELTDYQIEMAKKAFAQYQGKKVIVDEMETYRFTTYVTQSGRKINMDTAKLPFFWPLDND